MLVTYSIVTMYGPNLINILLLCHNHGPMLEDIPQSVFDTHGDMKKLMWL